MTVARLNAEMGHDEYVGWRMYYARKAQREELEMKKAEARKGKR